MDTTKKVDEIPDLRKMAEQTGQAVTRRCLGKNTICVGFSLLFLDPMEPVDSDERWNYTIDLIGNPERDMDPEERKRLEACFELINEGVKRIYQEGIPDEAPKDYKARPGYHS